jgi:RHS repeat-associated protein
VAVVQGTADTVVNWSATSGTITAAGAYTAPNTFGTYTVTSTAHADAAVRDEATVVVPGGSASGTFTYDLNGNLTSDGVRTFEWDAENRLVAVVIGTHRSEFVYDELGRRVEILEKDNNVMSSDKKYLWDGTEIAEERDSTGATAIKKFYSQGFVDTDATNLYYTRDHLGSIRELTDSTQAIRARYDYDPYGRVTKISGDRDSIFLYTGHLWHSPSGFYLTLYRAYDPNLGRWISRDPIGGRGGQNLYGYVTNDPVNAIDPFGLTKVYGNWCGPDWTGGRVEQYTPHEPGYYKPPIDDLDKACEAHDVCYYSCRKDNPCDKEKRSSCFRLCDYILTGSAYAIGGFWGRTVGAAIDRPGKRDPGPNDCGCSEKK